MKAIVAVALGALALVGCGALDASEEAGQVAQGFEQAFPDPKPAQDVAPRNPTKTDQEKLTAPEHQTFLTTFIYQTDIDATPAPFIVEPLPGR